MKSKRRTIFEIILILIIILQGVVIYFLLDSIYIFSNASKLMADVPCIQTLGPLREYKEAGDYDSLIVFGEDLLRNGYDNDSLILSMLSYAYYVKENKMKAAEMLEASIEGKYYCEMLKPTLEILDEATHRFQLSGIYEEIGRIDKSKQEYQKANELAKHYYGEKYDEKRVKRFADSVLFKNIRTSEVTQVTK